MTRAVFLGTPTQAIPCLTALSRLVDVATVITRPDRPRGRSRRPLPPPVKEAALDLGIPVTQPSTTKDLAASLRREAPLDVGVLVAFGMIIPASVLEIPGRGFLNVHFSLLPRWRGAAPIERAILAGDSETGVTIIRMDEELDTGPIVASREVELGPGDTAEAVGARLAHLGADLLEEILDDFLAGRLEAHPQSAGATQAERIDRKEARLDFSSSAAALSRRVRAFNARPGAYARWRGKRIKVWEVRFVPGVVLGPGELLLRGDALLVGTGDGTLELVEVQLAGARRMSGIDWARGIRGGLGALS